MSQLWVDFLKTVDDCFNSKSTCEKQSAEPHFWGAIVPTKSSKDSYEITDSKQRLTSSSILIKVLSEIYDRILDHFKKSRIKNKLEPLIQRNEYGDPFGQRIFLDPTINEFFKNYILLKNSNEDRSTYLSLNKITNKNSSRQRIVDAYNFFYDRLTEQFPEDMYQDKLHDKLLCYINVFTRYFILLRILVSKKRLLI